MDEYIPQSNWVNLDGTSLQGCVEASFAQLRQIFGDPLPETDGYKVSTEWVLLCPVDGMTVTLYDYKETNLYSKDYPTVEEFRANPSYEWHVGAKDKFVAERFIAWLKWKLATDNADIPAIIV